MSKLVWDAAGQREYEMGVSKGVLYVMPGTGETAATGSSYKAGVAWNGLTGVTNSPEGAEPTDLWADNIKYATLRSAETFGATIEAYTYPDDFGVCDGSAEPISGVKVNQQARRAFAFCYRTEIGNDTNPEAGYLIHIIYNCTASPSERAYETVNDSPDAITFSWEVKSNPVTVGGSYTNLKPTSEFIIDSTKLAAGKLTALENKLYGTDGQSGTEPTLPDPNDLLDLIANASSTT